MTLTLDELKHEANYLKSLRKDFTYHDFIQWCEDQMIPESEWFGILMYCFDLSEDEADTIIEEFWESCNAKPR